jgi:hypothetical protein
MNPDNDEPFEYLGGKHKPFTSDFKRGLPTRILKVTGTESVRLPVVDPANPRKAHYACPSQCWGGIKVLSLDAITAQVLPERHTMELDATNLPGCAWCCASP